MTIRNCAHCGNPFEPRPQVRNQTYCSSAECQRVRKRLWQRHKLQDDSIYRESQLDAQRAWRQRNPDYWRSYREARPEYDQRSGHQQGGSVAGRTRKPAKMDVSSLPAGLYRIRAVVLAAPVPDGAYVVEITPVCPDCPYNMDACKQKT